MSKKFDEHIKNLLENHKTSGNADWSDFEKKLGQEVTIFDEQFKNILLGHKVDSSADWFDFEKKLDQEVVLNNDEVFDETLKNAVLHHKSSYNSEHWKILRSRLERQLELKRTILINKSLELVTMSLLLFVFYNWGPLSIEKSGIDQTSKPILIAKLSPTPQSDIQKQLILDHSHRAINKEEIEKVDLSKKVAIFVENRSELKPSEIRFESKFFEFLENDLQGEDRPRNYQLKEKIAEVFENQSSPATDILIVVDRIDPLDYNLAVVHELPIPLMVNVENQALIEKRIGVYGVGDLNVINRPFDFKFIQEPRTYGAFGASWGASYGIKKGKNEFETGLAVSIKTFDPNQLERLDILSSRYERDFNQQKFTIVQVPFRYKRYTTNKKKSSFYSTAGFDVNFVAHTDYTVDDRLTRGFPRPASFIESSSSLSQKDFHSGLLQGGTLVKNAYLTANIGFGYEAKIGKSNFFIEPSFKQHLFAQKLGPNDEKLNAFSIATGVKFNI